MKTKQTDLYSLATGITRVVIPLLLVVLLFSSCATGSFSKSPGMTYYHSGDYDKAVEYFEKALKEKPNRQDLRLLLFKAKLNSYYTHLARARKLKEAGKKEEAIKEYNLVLKIFPDNKKIITELDAYTTGIKPKPKVFESTIKPPVTLTVDPGEKMDLKLRSTPITKIFKVVGKSFGVNFVFDKDFRDFVYNIDTENIGFYEILNQLCMVGNAEYRVLDQRSVLIFPNTTFKKRTFGLRGVKNFFLSNVGAEDAKKLLMTVFRDQQIQVQEDKNLNSLIVKADYGTMVSIEKFLYSVDKRKSEVELDVQILQLSKNTIQALGTSFGDAASPAAGLTVGVPDDTGAISTTFNVNDIKNANFILTIPSAALSFLESDDRNRIIARPNLRGVDGEEIKFMVGEEVPVPQTQFQAGAAGGISNIPVTTYQYRNVGTEVKLTPYIHREGEVTLKIKLTINSISAYENNFPIFGKRELENIIRLKEGETNIIGGFIRDEVRSGLQGLRGLARIPVIGKLFGATGKTVKQTDVVFSVTPRIIRRLELTDIDKQAIWGELKGGAAGGGGDRGGDIREQGPGRRPGIDRRNGAGRPGRNSVAISPTRRRVPVNGTSFFTVKINSNADFKSLSLSGSISGGDAVIEDLKTEFFSGQKVQILKNHSGDSFDLGYTFPDEGKARVNTVAQMRVKFTSKGTYTISITSANAIDKNNQSIELSTSDSEVEVY